MLNYTFTIWAHALFNFKCNTFCNFEVDLGGNSFAAPIGKPHHITYTTHYYHHGSIGQTSRGFTHSCNK